MSTINAMGRDVRIVSPEELAPEWDKNPYSNQKMLKPPCFQPNKIRSTICPCCSNVMLRHFRRYRVYWFCRSCWQEMPDLTLVAKKNHLRKDRPISRSVDFKRLSNKKRIEPIY